MKFVVKLLESVRFDVLMTVVDLVFKRMHSISTYTNITVEDTIRLFLYVWKLNNVSTCVFLDRELQFVTYFIKKSYYVLGTKRLLYQ